MNIKSDLIFFAPTLWNSFQIYFPTFFFQGLLHVLTGYDHLLFILGLHLLVPSWWQMLKIATAFTISHSLTLAFSVTGYVLLPSALTEIAIAFTIMWIGVENCLVLQFSNQKKNDSSSVALNRFDFFIRHRWVTAFLFGLIHGLGFSTLLKTLMPSSSVVAPLLGFNLGVEAAQIFCIALLMPILFYLRKKINYQMLALVASILIVGAGITWIILRIFY